MSLRVYHSPQPSRLRIEAVHPTALGQRSLRGAWPRDLGRDAYDRPAADPNLGWPSTAAACWAGAATPGRSSFTVQAHWGRAPTLQTEQGPLRTNDTHTVFLFELENFADIGATPLFPVPFAWPVYALIPAGAVVSLWFGARPAVGDVLAGARNLRVLKREDAALLARQAALRRQRQHPGATAPRQQTIDRELRSLSTRLGLTAEEWQNELVDRVISGALIAPGSLLTGTGTLLTPGFLAPAHNALAAACANLLTGFVGNGPVATYAVVNAIYHGREAWQAGRRLQCLRRCDLNRTWPGALDVNGALRRRQRAILGNCILKAVSSLGVGLGGLITAITPLGYAVLVPFAVGRACSDYFAQKKLGYTRRALPHQRENLSRRSLVNEFIYCVRVHDLLKSAKNRVRRRYPWGVHAPLPFNLLFAGAKLLRRRRPVVGPAAHTETILRDYGPLAQDWLQRRVATVYRNKARLYAVTTCGDDGFAARQQGKLDDNLRLLRRQATQLVRVSQAAGTLDCGTPPPLTAYARIERIVTFFVDMDLFGLLAPAMYKSEALRLALRAATEHVSDRPKRVTIDAARFLDALRAPTARFLDSPGFVDAFYLCVEGVLVCELKQHLQEKGRELMDMITMRLAQKESRRTSKS